MFNRLKTFSEDVAKSINEIQQGDPVRKNAESIRQLKNGTSVLNTKTPESKELLQPEDESELKSQTPKPDEKTPIATSGPLAGVDMDALPGNVRAKLKKFVKYEEKYPVLLDAYKTEKKKAELVAAFEKVLQECTPVSSIADAGVLVEFLKSINEKTALVEGELKKLLSENKELKLAKAELTKKMADAEKTLKYAEENLEKASSQLQTIAELKKKLEETDSSQQIAELKKKLEESDSSEQLRAKTEQFEALTAEHKAAQEKLHGLESQHKDAQEKILSLESELKSLQSLIEVSSKKVQQLEEEAASTKKELSELKSKPQAAPAQNTQNRKKKGKKGKTTSNGVEEPDWQANHTELLQKHDLLIEEKQKLEADLQAANKSALAKEEEIETLKDSLRLVGDDLVTAKDELKALKEAPKDQVSLESLNQLQKQYEAEKAKNSENSAQVTELKGKITTLTKDLETSTKSVQSLETEKQKLNERLSELNKFKSSDSSLKLEIASLQLSVSHKDEHIKELRAELEKKNKERDELNAVVSQLKGANSELQNNSKLLAAEKAELINKQEVAFERTNQLNSELSKLQVSRQSVVSELESLKVKYETLVRTKANSADEVQVFKQQCDELSMKSKEAQTRIDNLEDELSETKNILQERTRESSTIKRLLLDAEEQATVKAAEYKAEIRGINEEKAELESALKASLKRKQREVDELKAECEQQTARIQELEQKCQELEQKYEPLAKEGAVSSETKQKYSDMQNTIEELRASLQESSKRVKDFENVNRVLKKLNEEAGVKFERLSQNYKHVTQQYRQMQSAGKPPRKSEEQVEPSEDKQTTTAYLKNVLVGFLEHKDQRDQLLPVVKTLFQLDDEDEKKLLGALN